MENNIQTEYDVLWLYSRNMTKYIPTFTQLTFINRTRYTISIKWREENEKKISVFLFGESHFRKTHIIFLSSLQYHFTYFGVFLCGTKLETYTLESMFSFSFLFPLVEFLKKEKKKRYFPLPCVFLVVRVFSFFFFLFYFKHIT